MQKITKNEFTTSLRSKKGKVTNEVDVINSVAHEFFQHIDRAERNGKIFYKDTQGQQLHTRLLELLEDAANNMAKRYTETGHEISKNGMSLKLPLDHDELKSIALFEAVAVTFMDKGLEKMDFFAVYKNTVYSLFKDYKRCQKADKNCTALVAASLNLTVENADGEGFELIDTLVDEGANVEDTLIEDLAVETLLTKFEKEAGTERAAIIRTLFTHENKYNDKKAICELLGRPTYDDSAKSKVKRAKAAFASFLKNQEKSF